MLNQYAVDIPALQVNLCLSHLIQFLVECLAVPLECRAAKRGRQAFGIHKVFREMFCKSSSVFFSTLSAGVESMDLCYIRTNSPITWGEEWEPNTSSGSEMPVRIVSQKSVIPHKKRFFKELGNRPRTTADLRSSFRQILHSSNICLLKDKTEVCTCSQFPTEAMLWIKEVDLVDSVDDLKSSCSVRGIRMPDFSVLDAKIASALNRIIHNILFQKKGQSGRT